MTTKQLERLERKELKGLESALSHAVELKKALGSVPTMFDELTVVPRSGPLIAKKCTGPLLESDIEAVDRLIAFLRSVKEKANPA